MSVNDEEDLLCSDFESTLFNVNEVHAYMKKLKESCSNFHTKLERNIFETISKSSEKAKQIEKSHETLSQLSNQRKELKAELEKIKLDQKVVEKQAINIMKEIEETKSDIECIKENQEKLCLQIVDLEQESQKSKQYMKGQWNAIKNSCKPYKNILDIHIETEKIDHMEHVTITFFYTENPTDQKFFIVLMYQDNCWKVKKIEPELSIDHKYQLNHIVQFSKQAEVTNVTSLLCGLRKLFIKNYFNK